MGVVRVVRVVGVAWLPSLAKEGWPRHQQNGPVPLEGADGVVCSIKLFRDTISVSGQVVVHRFHNRKEKRPNGPGTSKGL